MVSGQAKEWKNTFSFRAGGLPLWISPWVPKNKLGNVVASFCVDAMFEINYFRFCKPFTTILGEDLASGENYRPQSHYWQSGTSCSLQFCFENCTAAGADARIWPTQFGFRTGRRCADALFVARRLLEGTCPAKHGSLLFLARRFGIPNGFCAIIRAIYSGRKFVVRDAGHTSEPKPQHFGISHGCPLSPFLFSIVMTVFLFDAWARLAKEVETRQPYVLLFNGLVCADDVGTDPSRAKTHMRCIEAMGMKLWSSPQLEKGSRVKPARQGRARFRAQAQM